MLIWVALAGGLGAVARFVVDGLVQRRVSVRWPLGTFVINVLGSLLLGLVTGLVARGWPGVVGAVVGTGFLGGFTTFSAASVEVVRLWGERRPLGAVLHACSMVLVGVLAALGGFALAWALSR